MKYSGIESDEETSGAYAKLSSALQLRWDGKRVTPTKSIAQICIRVKEKILQLALIWALSKHFMIWHLDTFPFATFTLHLSRLNSNSVLHLGLANDTGMPNCAHGTRKSVVTGEVSIKPKYNKMVYKFNTKAWQGLQVFFD